MKVGSSEHRDLFCRTFIATHKAYEPEDLPWPVLEPRYLERLRSIPFWSVARAMERKAGIMVGAFAKTLDDPLVREAVAVQGLEEARHARMMTHLIEHYHLDVDDLWVKQPEALKADFVVFGYEECLDFFMGAGLFRVASELDYFPRDFIAIFEEILLEEARHVTFFINWFRYEEANAGRDRWPGRLLQAGKNYVSAIKGLVASFSGEQTTGFAAAGANSLIEGITPTLFLESALAENRRFMSMLDPRLVKPSLLPTLAGIALTALRALPPVRHAKLALVEDDERRSAAA
ncbi:MAG: hypothetical protein NVSMB64_06520 [Candidatus Velthaea sp.]